MITVTAAIIKENGHFLAARRKSGSHLAGYWEFPGGKLEPGETNRNCLARELLEEFGVTCSITDFVAESIFDYGNKIVRLRGYRAHRLGGTFQCRDHDQICWLPVDELQNLTWAPADIPILEKLIEQEWASSTDKYYRENGQAYVQETANNTGQYPFLMRFLSMLPPRASVLDLGCGSGRDSRLFIDQGFQVTPVDASPEIAKFAADYLGYPVRRQRAEDLDDAGLYDGVWACASLVHIPESLMQKIFQRILTALKPGGIWYMSFKSGGTEKRDDSNRFFNNYSLLTMTELLAKFPDATIIDINESTSSLRNKKQQWLNIFVRKKM
ncbi:MAG: NUDIX domain-containing protein [Desulforhopalus sp.]